MSDATGTLTDTYDYEAFGELLNHTGSTENSYLFTGEQFDAGLNQYYLRARYYNQQVGLGTAILFNMAGGAAGKLVGMLGSKIRKACNSFDGETLVATEFGLMPSKSLRLVTRF